MPIKFWLIVIVLCHFVHFVSSMRVFRSRFISQSFKMHRYSSVLNTNTVNPTTTSSVTQGVVSEKLLMYLQSLLKNELNFRINDNPKAETIATRLVQQILTSSALSSDNQRIHECGTKLLKVIRKFPEEDFQRLISGNTTALDMISSYENNVLHNNEVYLTITNHHQQIAQSTWNNTLTNVDALKQYSKAASDMGNKSWVQESNDWMANFAINFFRHGTSIKQFHQLHAINAKKDPHGKEDSPYQQLPKDVLQAVQQHEDPKIKMLDVGSCYNPISRSTHASYFDITAIDLYPADETVHQCDFLNLVIGPPDSDPIYEQQQNEHEPHKTIQVIKQLPAASFDVITMSLVLSYLPNPEQREVMIQKARALLRCPGYGNQPHYTGLLLLIEKDSIITHINEYQSMLIGERTLHSAWKHNIIKNGYHFMKYNYMKSEEMIQNKIKNNATNNAKNGKNNGMGWKDRAGHRCHAFAFTARDWLPTKEEEIAHYGQFAKAKLWIKHDFERILGSNNNDDEEESQDAVETSSGGCKPNAYHRRRSSPFPSYQYYPVGIVGGGIGGTALALALQQRNIPFLLFEKDANFNTRRQGYGLTMQQGGIALRELGLTQAVLDEGIITASHYSYTAQGELLGAYGYDASYQVCSKTGKMTPNHPAEAITKEGEEKEALSIGRHRHNVHIPRQKLRELMLNKLNPQYIQWDKKLIDLKPLRTTTTDTAAANSTNANTNNSLPLDPHGMELIFHDNTSYPVSVVIGADGIYSTVRQLFLQQMNLTSSLSSAASSSGATATATATTNVSNANTSTAGSAKNVYDLSYLHLMVILGISNIPSQLPNHQYLSQQQWLNGQDTRVYTMPFTKDTTMWQLSFRLTESEALSLSSQSVCASNNSNNRVEIGKRLKTIALQRIQDWDPKVKGIIEATNEEEISGHPLYERDFTSSSTKKLPEDEDDEKESFLFPLLTPEQYAAGNEYLTRISFCGDAIHPMSAFKAQGANQAILDALYLSKAIVTSQYACASRRTIGDALREFEEEMMIRAVPKVLKSRDAAMFLHSPAGLASGNVTRALAAEKSVK